MARHSLLLSVLAAVLLFGCRATVPVSFSRPERRLVPVDSVILPGTATGMCRDGDALVLLEASGTRLLRVSAGSVAVETIPLTRRLASPRGIYVDRFYFYAWDETALYRMSKQDLVLKPWLNNVRATGVAGYAPGEALVADAERNVVWLKTLFGESREFLSAGTVTQPGPIATASEGVFCLLASRRRLLWFNRAGIMTRAVVLDADCDLLAVDASGRAFVLSRASPILLVVSERGRELVELGGVANPVEIVAGTDRLFVLDDGSRVVTFRLP